MNILILFIAYCLVKYSLKLKFVIRKGFGGSLETIHGVPGLCRAQCGNCCLKILIRSVSNVFTLYVQQVNIRTSEEDNVVK
jgi:hypothetical protein